MLCKKPRFSRAAQTFFFLVITAFLAGCGTDQSPVASDKEPQAEMAAKPAGKGISIGKVKRPRSITLADGAVMEKRVFVFFEEGFMTQYEGEAGNLESEKGKCKKNCGEKCFKLWAKGAGWQTTEPYVLDANGSGLTTKSVISSIESSLSAWDEEVTFNLFGERDKKSQVDGVDYEAPDRKNEIMFREIADPGVIAFTIVWGIFTGSPRDRKLVEWDLVFNSNESWGNAGDPNETGLDDISVMDLQNIATHEVGHAAGMDHSSEKCIEETMYPFAERGETKKRTLHTGDKQGIKDL